MPLHITVTGNGGLPARTLTLDPGSTVADVYAELNLSHQVCIAELGGQIVPIDHPLVDNDALFLIRAQSGG